MIVYRHPQIWVTCDTLEERDSLVHLPAGSVAIVRQTGRGVEEQFIKTEDGRWIRSAADPGFTRAIGVDPSGQETLLPVPGISLLHNHSDHLLGPNEYLWGDDEGWEDVHIWDGGSTYTVIADQDGFSQGQYSDDGVHLRTGAVLRAYSAGLVNPIVTGSHRLRYWRLQFLNGPVAQSFFTVQTFHHLATPGGPVFRLDQEVNDGSVAQNVRALLGARNPLDPNGKYEPVEWLEGGIVVANRSTGKTLKRVAARLTENDNLIAAVPGKRIKVFALFIEKATAGAKAKLLDGQGGFALTNNWNLDTFRPPLAVQPPTFLFATSAGNALRANVDGSVDFEVSYWDDDTL